ncbi:MAG: hypothetical protein IJW92_05175 [Clostridia bacterium]|nr:hypothetical protein [Clostridia bacterium]
MRLLPFSGDAPAVGDLLILTSPQNGQPQTAFERVLETLLRKDTLQAALRGVYTVRKSGLMRELTEITNSAWIDLTRFSPLGLSMPMTVLTDQYGGSRILRVSSKAAATVLNACSTAGLQAFVFAAVTANGKMTFSRDAKNHFSISTQFLRMIFHYQSVSAKLADERQLSADPISHRTVVGANCAYLSTGNAQNASEVSAVNGVLCAASSAVPTRAFFKTALYTTLAPIVTLAAHGADYTAEILTLGLEIPEKHTNPHAVGEIMSTILGAYRVQAELGIAAQATPIRTAPDRSHPSLSAFALTNGVAKPSTLTAEDNAVYLLMPQICANGLPDFDALRKWLEALSNLSRQGVICSCRTLVGEAVTDGICKMSGTYTCRITDTAIASEEKLPLAVLIESKQDLPFRRVGTVKKAEIPPEDIPPCFAHQHASLIWSEAPEVVIVASKHDSDAAVLASVLERRGCTVHSFSDREDESDPLSRAILGAQYCLICGSARLPQSSKMKFAISTMKRAGGLLLSLGEKGDPSDSSVCLPNGLTEEILQKI